MNWDDLKFFLTLFETNKVSTAAIRLNVNYATVSRRIERLEESLKLKLFDRTQDGYKPTIEGTLLYEMSLDMRNKITNLEEHFSPDAKFKQNTTISMVPFLAENLIIEKLSPFCKQHPQLRIEFDTSHRNVNISKQEADIALRLELPEKGESLCRKLGEIPYVLYGQKYWIDKIRHGENINIITYTTAYTHLPECKYLLDHFGNKSIKIQSNAVSAQKIAAENGYGIALIPKIAVQDGNTNTLSPQQEIKREVWMLTSRKSSSSTSTKLITEELVKIFTEEKLNCH
jgi:DNA-binding transcriptional LysR family regulator